MEKVMESHGIWRAQKNTNPVNYMCSVVLIITGKDLPIPNSRVQNVSCWNGNSEEPAPPPPPSPYLYVDIYCILTSANFQKRNWGCSLCLCREYNVHVYKAISRKVVANSARDNPERYCR